MRTLLTLVLIASLTGPAFAGGRRRAAAVSPLPQTTIQADLTISFPGVSGNGSEGWIDTGLTSKRIEKQFAIRIDSPADANGTVTLRASLETTDARVRLRIDGHLISAVPTVITSRARIGVAAMHTLEIEIPASVPAGTFATSLRWDASTN